MDENQNETEEILLDEKVRKDIEAKAQELQKQKNLRQVFPIIVYGNKHDSKEMYIGYFRQPTFVSFSKYLKFSQQDQAAAMKTLATDCFLAGDRELVDDDSLFMFGLMGQFSQVIEMRHGKLVNL